MTNVYLVHLKALRSLLPDRLFVVLFYKRRFWREYTRQDPGARKKAEKSKDSAPRVLIKLAGVVGLC